MIFHFFFCSNTIRDENGVDVERTDFLPVFVYDKDLREIVQSQLKRLNRVRVEGIIKYKVDADHLGKKRYRGYILATRIAKMINFNEVEKPMNVKRKTRQTQ